MGKSRHTGKIDFCQDFIVSSVILPSNVHDGAKAALVKLFWTFDLLSVRHPCLDALQEGIDDNNLLYQSFGGEVKREVCHTRFCRRLNALLAFEILFSTFFAGVVLFVMMLPRYVNLCITLSGCPSMWILEDMYGDLGLVGGVLLSSSR